MSGAPKLPSTPPPTVEASDVKINAENVADFEKSTAEILKQDARMERMDDELAEDVDSPTEREGETQPTEVEKTELKGEAFVNALDETGNYLLIVNASDNVLIEAYNLLYDKIEDLESSGQSETITSGPKFVYLGMMKKIIDRLEGTREHELKMENDDPKGHIEGILKYGPGEPKAVKESEDK